LASPIQRLVAFFLDLALYVAIPAGVIWGIVSLVRNEVDKTFITEAVAALLAVLGGWYAVLIVAMSRGTTPGKAALGLRVHTADGRQAGFWRMFFRETLGKWISGLVFGMGWIWILIDRTNQGWHDKLMSTFVMAKSDDGPANASVASVTPVAKVVEGERGIAAHHAAQVTASSTERAPNPLPPPVTSRMLLADETVTTGIGEITVFRSRDTVIPCSKCAALDAASRHCSVHVVAIAEPAVSTCNRYHPAPTR
jgi:uncharacterized RDD family membrane protein YckC